MTDILLPVDGSQNALRAVQKLVTKRDWFRSPFELHLLNAQLPIASGLIKSFISQTQLEHYYRDQGLAALHAARSVLDKGGVPYQYHIGVGKPAETILEYARDKHSDVIIMGTHGHGALQNVLLGSVAMHVVHGASIPVLLIS